MQGGCASMTKQVLILRFLGEDISHQLQTATPPLVPTQALCASISSHLWEESIEDGLLYLPSFACLVYCYKSCISVLPVVYTALTHLSFISLSPKGCAWFPSRVQQFLCWMKRLWHHVSALHLALPCAAPVWDCLGF